MKNASLYLYIYFSALKMHKFDLCLLTLVLMETVVMAQRLRKPFFSV